MRPLFAHNEYIKLDGNGNITLTTNLSEAIKWDDYTNLPLWLIFTEDNIPSELTTSWVPDDFRNAYTQWVDAQYGCLSFIETDPDPDTENDRIEIDFSINPDDFNDPVWELALTTWVIQNQTRFIVHDQNTGQTTNILFNNTDDFYFTWTHTQSWGLQNFLHVALHETGHLIGLNHCTQPNYPVMIAVFDYYNIFHPRVWLTDDDKQGWQNLCDYITGIEDFITITSEYETYNVDQTYAGVLSRTFTDVFPYGDYITQWGNYQIQALSNCGEILVYESPYGDVLIPPLPNYIWQRDSYGNVIAKVSTSGIF